MKSIASSLLGSETEVYPEKLESQYRRRRICSHEPNGHSGWGPEASRRAVGEEKYRLSRIEANEKARLERKEKFEEGESKAEIEGAPSPPPRGTSHTWATIS